jgi:hypothetical protein
MELTVAQAQELWLRANETSPANREAVRMWVFEHLADEGFDVRDDVITKLS